MSGYLDKTAVVRHKTRTESCGYWA